MHIRILIYRKVIQYSRRTFLLPLTCRCATIEGFCLQVQEIKRRSYSNPYNKKFPTFCNFSYNRKVTDVALSLKPAGKLRYQSQKKRSFYEHRFVRRCDLSVEIRHDKRRAGNRWNMNITLGILLKMFLVKNWHDTVWLFKLVCWHV